MDFPIFLFPFSSFIRVYLIDSDALRIFIRTSFYKMISDHTHTDEMTKALK